MSDLISALRIICSENGPSECGEAADEIERLQDLFRLAARNCERYEERLSETEERLEQAARDSARYRWLVNCNDGGVWSFLSGMDDDQIDEEIDRWMAENEGHCAECEGSGLVASSFGAFAAPGTQPDFDECPKCKGTGAPSGAALSVAQDWYCSECGKTFRATRNVCPYCHPDGVIRYPSATQHVGYYRGRKVVK